MVLRPSELLSTYSIVARDPQTGQFGVAVQTHQMCVGGIVPWLAPGVGAVATQSLVNIAFGPIALAMLGEGVPAPQVIAALVASDEEAHRRQVAVVDGAGRAAAWTGEGCIPEAAHQVGEGYSVQANMMTYRTVVPAMAAAFEAAAGDLAARMLAALRAAQAEGGDIRGVQSAALKVVSGRREDPCWRAAYDLRVDEHDDPVTELSRLVRLRHAQLLDDQGYEALKANDYSRAMELWAQARAQAPELEELPFWQAMALADDLADPEAGVRVLRPALRDDPRSEHWLDLAMRLQACGLVKRGGAAAELVQRLRQPEGGP